MYHPNHLLATALTLVLLVLGGCGDDKDKDKAGATGPEGMAAPITDENIAQVQGAVQQNLAAAVAKGPGTHRGAVSGSVEVAISAGRAAQTGVAFSLDFDNYSDDGSLWFDGTVFYSLSGADVFYRADLRVQGDYDGRVEGEVDFTDGRLGGFWTVDGQRYDLGGGAAGGQNPPVGGGTVRVPEGQFGAVFDLDGASGEYLDPGAGQVIPITGLGDQRFLSLGGGRPGTINRIQLRMIPINQTGTFTCGEGPSSFRIVHIWYTAADGTTYLAGEQDRGECTIEVSRVGAVYEGTFSARVFNDAGESIGITNGSFRNDGSAL